jgi:hypothetical protein
MGVPPNEAVACNFTPFIVYLFDAIFYIQIDY